MTDTATETKVAGAAPPVAGAESVTITVQNLSTALTDEEAQAMTAALNIQGTRDWNGSCWVSGGLADSVAKVVFIPKGDPIPADSWHVELLDSSDQEGALGYHEDEAFKKGTPDGKPEKASTHSSRGRRADAPSIPLAKVFCKTTKEDGEQPSEVASHEMLEMLGDPQVINELRTVTDPTSKRIYPVEVGDPVQSSGYKIEVTTDAGKFEVEVANFALPAYFKLPQAEHPKQYDWCSVLTAPVPAMTPGGYLSYAPEDEPENWQQEFGSKAASAGV